MKTLFLLERGQCAVSVQGLDGIHRLFVFGGVAPNGDGESNESNDMIVFDPGEVDDGWPLA